MKPEEKIERAYEELRAIIDGGSESFTHEDAVQYLKDRLAQPEQEKERCVGCEACIDTACGRDECPKGWPKAVQPEQEPVEWGVDWGKDGNSVSIIKRLADGNIEVLAWEYSPHPPQPKEPEQEPVPAAMKTVIEAMQQDPDYAWGWHCNIAMSFVDAGGDHYTGNQGAARFMRTLANVEPAHELPFSPPQRTWVGLMRGVRVDGDTVVISVKGGNDAARELCGELINEMNK